jgi:hypothetical protein
MREASVMRALQIIQNELDMTMAFCGQTDIRKVDRSILRPGYGGCSASITPVVQQPPPDGVAE